MRNATALILLLFPIACASAPRIESRPETVAPATRPAATVASDVEACLDAGLLPVLPARPAISAAANDDELTRKTQNPVADLISVPLQNNFNFGVGPDKDLQYILNVQPVWPVKLNNDWNLITRTILPIVYQPQLAPGVGDEFGLGDTLFTAFLSPRKESKLIWGAGPAVLIPTSTDNSLGVGQWGLGPSAVALTMKGRFVYGALISNVWSFEGDYNAMTLQPFVNYNFPSGWYVCSVPIITANWKADSDNTWTVPIGGGGGKIVKIGKLPVNCQGQIFYNVGRPDGSANWSLRIQFQLLFPK